MLTFRACIDAVFSDVIRDGKTSPQKSDRLLGVKMLSIIAVHKIAVHRGFGKVRMQKRKSLSTAFLSALNSRFVAVGTSPLIIAGDRSRATPLENH